MATTNTTITTWAMRPSVRPITASTTSGITRATSTAPSTTPMTILTSTIAWCTPCVERARWAHSFTLDVVSHLIGSSPESFHIHPWSSSWRTLFDSFLLFYFYLFLPVFSFYFLHSELYPELDNPIVMESLCLLRQQGEWGRLRRPPHPSQDEPKELAWYWTRETFSLCVRSFEESNSSSSTFSASTSRRGWSGSFLENKRKSSKNNSHILFIGLTIDGKHAWQQEEEQKGDFSTALMIHK